MQLGWANGSLFRVLVCSLSGSCLRIMRHVYYHKQRIDKLHGTKRMSEKRDGSRWPQLSNRPVNELCRDQGFALPGKRQNELANPPCSSGPTVSLMFYDVCKYVRVAGVKILTLVGEGISCIQAGHFKRSQSVDSQWFIQFKSRKLLKMFKVCVGLTWPPTCPEFGGTCQISKAIIGWVNQTYLVTPCGWRSRPGSTLPRYFEPSGVLEHPGIKSSHSTASLQGIRLQSSVLCAGVTCKELNNGKKLTRQQG